VPTGRNLGWILSVAGGATLVAAVVVTGAVLAIGTTVTIQASERSDTSLLARLNADHPVSARAGGAPTSTVSTTQPSSSTQSTGSLEPAAGVSSSAAEIVPTSLSTTGSTTVSGDGATAGPGAELLGSSSFDPALLPSPETVGDGVFALSGDDVVRLGLFTAVDGLILTSASAVDDHELVLLAGGGQWVEAIVLASDPPTDVAVLGPTGLYLDDFAAAIDETERSTRPPAAGTGIQVPVAGSADGETAAGIIIGTDQRILAGDSIPIYGALLTTARRPENGGGATLLDSDGRVIGLLLGSTGYLASAVPIDTALSIARTLVEWNVPTLDWLGVEGRTHDGGGAEHHTVIDGSPADLAGLRPGDVITDIEDAEVVDWFHLIHLVRHWGSGATVAVVVERGPSTRELTVDIGTRAGELIG
jgi:S1-C subfamily serine protease